MNRNDADGRDDLARLLGRSLSPLSAQAAIGDDEPVLGWRGNTLSRAEMTEAINELDDTLAALGAAGTHVLLYGPLCPAYVIGLFACLRHGAVPVPIDAGMTAEQYAWIERTARPSLIISNDVSALDQHRGVAGSAELVLAGGTGRVVLDATAGGLNPGAFRHADPDAGYLIPTSGSTGKPKAVVGSRHGLHVFLSWFIDEFALGPEDVCAAATRVSFDPSLRELLAVLSVGGRLLLPEVDAQLDPAELARHLAADGVTVAFLVPSLAWRTAQALADQSLDLPTLRYGFFAGERLHGRVVAAWAARAPHAEFVNLYGMTEGTLAQLYQRRVRAEDSAGRGVPVGRPRPGVSVTIDDPDEQGRGEVHIRSSAPALGLLRGEPSDAAAPPIDVEPMPDVLRTGDLGFVDSNGEIVVIGRLNDDMKVSGRRVSFHAFVDALEALPFVSQCVVVDVADAGRPHAFLAVGAQMARDAWSYTRIRDIVRGLARDFELPQPAFHLRPDLPLLRSGKVDRLALAAEAARTYVTRAATSQAHRTADAATDDDGGDDVVTADLLALLGPAAPPAASMSFAEAGLTSLELIDFVLEVNRRHGTKLSVRDCYDLRDVTGVARVVMQSHSEPAAQQTVVRGDTPDATAADSGNEYPLSTRQLAYMAACMADGNANWCNLSREVVVSGSVTAGQVEAAVATLIARHDVLRLVLSADGTRLTHFAPESLHAPIAIDPGTGADSTGLADLAAHRARVEAVRARTVAPLLDVTAPPPLRLAVVPGPNTTSVIFVGHHLFLDGLTMDLLADELRALLDGRPLGQAPTQSYRAYCTATRREPRHDETAHASSPAARYWLDLLADSGQTQLPEADGDDARAGELLSVPFGLSGARAAHRIAASAGVSVFAVVLAAYHRAVAEVFSLGRFNIVIPVQVREGVRAATAGMFMSQLVVRGDPGAKLTDSAREFARQLDEGGRFSDFEFDERAEALGLAGSESFPISTVLFNQHPKHRGLRPDALGAWKPRALGRDLRYQLQGELQVSGAEMVLTYYYRRGIAPDAAALVRRVHGHLLTALAEAGGAGDDAH